MREVNAKSLKEDFTRSIFGFIRFCLSKASNLEIFDEKFSANE